MLLKGKIIIIIKFIDLKFEEMTNFEVRFATWKSQAVDEILFGLSDFRTIYRKVTLKGGECNSSQRNGMMKTATEGWKTIDFKKEMKIDFPIYYYYRNFKIYSSWQCT